MRFSLVMVLALLVGCAGRTDAGAEVQACLVCLNGKVWNKTEGGYGNEP